MSQSTDCYVPVDTDERLFWIEGSSWLADHKLVDGIRDRLPFDILPAALVNNVPMHETSFVLPADPSRWRNSLIWGKPVVRSGLDYGPMHRLHNCQFKAESEVSSGTLNLFCLHLTSFDAELRLRSHIQKLEARRIVPAGTSGEEAVHILQAIETEDLVVNRLKHEIAAIIAHRKDPSRPYWMEFDQKQTVGLNSNGNLGFGCDEAKAALEAMIRDGVEIVRSELLKA